VGLEGIAMKISFLSLLLPIALAVPASAQTSSSMAWMTSVEPASGKAGDVLTVHGANLGKDIVTALYLTDGKADIKVVMVEQTSAAIRFKIPSEANPGRFSLMVLTGKGAEEKLVEQPVRITVEPRGPTITS